MFCGLWQSQSTKNEHNILRIAFNEHILAAPFDFHWNIITNACVTYNIPKSNSICESECHFLLER